MSGFIWTPLRLAAQSMAGRLAPGDLLKIRENKGRSQVWCGHDVLVKRDGDRRGRCVVTVIQPFGPNGVDYLSRGGAL